MNCHYCGQAATVHLTDILKQNKRELHMCERCAREQQLLPELPSSEINLPALVQIIVDHPLANAKDSTTLTCCDCGLSYAGFRVNGQLGCPADYDVFRVALEPLLDRIHSSKQHMGKVPKKTSQAANRIALTDQLQQAILAEDYESAARIRDMIREKEGPDESR